MKRYVIATVGKTHSGKTTFARALEKRLQNSVVIDQDVHAEFLLKHYPSLVPTKGPHRLKFAITKSVVDYAMNETNQHMILCNSNENRVNRQKLLNDFHDHKFISILVHFDLPQEILLERIATSGRNTDILRTVSTFEEVLQMQESLTEKGQNIYPSEDEADHVLTVTSEEDTKAVIQRIIDIVEGANENSIDTR